MNNRHVSIFSLTLGFKFIVLFSSILAGVPMIGFVSNLFIGIFSKLLSRKEKLFIAVIAATVLTAYGIVGFIQTLFLLMKPISEILSPLVGMRSLTEEEASAILLNPNSIWIVFATLVLLFCHTVFTEYVTLTFGTVLVRVLRKRFKHFKQFEAFSERV